MRKVAIAFPLTLLFSTAALAQDAAPTTSLLCEGVAVVDNENDLFSLRNGKDEFADTVSFVLEESGEGRAKVPRRIQPSVKEHKDGWFPLIKVTKTDDEITGQIRMNSMYKPKFRLSRLSGSFTLSGNLGDFSGRCAPYDPATVKRMF